MPRLLFEKKGNAVWISHLDLMRLFQRAFKRAKLPLNHSQGFNPRPMVSIAMSLSVGVASCCELLDFELDGEVVPSEEIQTRLNENLIPGIRVLRVYNDGRAIKHLALLDCSVELYYEQGISEGAQERICKLFQRESLVVEKKGKNGVSEQDLIPMIRSLDVNQTESKTLQITARICCQNPTLNPMQLCAAVARYLPEDQPDFTKCSRIEIFDQDENVFR